MSVVYIDFSQGAQDIGQLLQMRAQSFPYDIAARHLSQTIDYITLHRRAKNLAATLQQVVSAGARAILMYDKDIDYTCALFACVYSGITAIPVKTVQNKNDIKNLKKIMLLSQASLLVTTESHMQWLGQSFWNATSAKNIWPVMTQFEKMLGTLKGYHDRGVNPILPAILQYTLQKEGRLLPTFISHQTLLQHALSLEGALVKHQEGMIDLIMPSLPQSNITTLRMVRATS